MRVVIDTNVIMSAIFFGGVPFEVLTVDAACFLQSDTRAMME